MHDGGSSYLRLGRRQPRGMTTTHVPLCPVKGPTGLLEAAVTTDRVPAACFRDAMWAAVVDRDGNRLRRGRSQARSRVSVARQPVISAQGKAIYRPTLLASIPSRYPTGDACIRALQPGRRLLGPGK